MKKKAIQEPLKVDPIQILEYLAHQASDSGLTEEFVESMNPQAIRLGCYLGCNQIQSILFSVLCNINFSHREVGIDRLANWFGCTPITVAMYVNDLEELRQKGILRKESDNNHYDLDTETSIASISYGVNPAVFEALRKGKRYRKPKMVIRDNYDLIRSVAGFIQQRAEGQIKFTEMEQEIRHIMRENSKMEFLKEVKRAALTIKEEILFLNLCDEYYNGCQPSNLPSMVKLVTSDKREQVSMRENIAGGYSGLIHYNLVECGESVFRNDYDISLTDKAIAILVKDNPKIVIEKKEVPMPEVMLYSSIPKKALFFTDDVRERYSEVRDLLIPANYDRLIKRLSKNNMKTGFAILFEGPPGTGKTESVYQLARQSGRNIFQVTISSLKSKWFGDSEKLIKSLFDRYRKLAEKSKIVPILLFNEADGVFASRKTNGSSPVDQTENAMQNIILQELEDLKGILIATTNLKANLDRAFDRRFMFKIHFGHPTPEARFRIWQEKIPFLTDTAAMELAEAHELSGGQIDNIARKCTMHQVLKGKPPVRLQVDAWCMEETGAKTAQKIGYRI